MNAIQLQSPGQFARIEVPEPAAPGPGEALVQVHRVAICGTDISGYLGKMPFFSYPRIPGHELGVEVVAIGGDVANVAPGDHCAVEPYLNCGECVACRRGKGNCCTALTVLGVHVDGGLRPRFVVPAHKLHRATQLSGEQLALVETLAIGRHAVQRANVARGERVLVIGAGPIGLSVIEFAALAGTEVAVADMRDERLAFCREKMGAATFTAGDGLLERVAEHTGGDLFDAVIDATGNAASMAHSLDMVCHGGRLVYVGITSDEIRFPHRALHAREATMLASRNALPEDFGAIIAAIERGDIDTRPWITHRVGFESFVETFDSYTRPETGVIKAVVEVDA